MQPQSRRGGAAGLGSTKVSKACAAGDAATILPAHRRGRRQDTQWADRQSLLRQRLVRQCAKVDWNRQGGASTTGARLGPLAGTRARAGRTRIIFIRITGTGSSVGAPARL